MRRQTCKWQSQIQLPCLTMHVSNPSPKPIPNPKPLDLDSSR